MKNLTITERLMRIIIAGVFCTLYFAQIVPGLLGLIVLIFGVTMLFTATIGMSIFYRVIGANTAQEELDGK